MKDCEKLIIIVYVNVSRIEDTQMSPYLEQMYDAIRDNFDDTVKIMFMPTFDESGESKIDVLNPKFIPEDEYKQIVKDFNEKYKEILKKIGKDGSNS